MAKTAILALKILGDASGAQKSLDDAASGVEKFEGGVGKLAKPAAGAVAAIALIGKVAVDAASDTQQSMGALDSVFGKNADVVKGWSDQAAESVGLSKAAYGDLASTLGAQLNNLTGDADVALKGTDSLITLGADLAATFGGTTADAVSALGSALRGEADPAERYGLALNQTTVNARLAEKGMSDLTGEALTAAKAQTVIELATEQAGGALGQFARETDTVAGSTQIATAQFQDAKSALGTALLPAVAAVTSKFADMAKWVQQNTTLFLVITGVIATLASAILALNLAFKVYRATAAAVAAVQKLQETALIGTRIQLAALAVQQKIVSAATKAYAAVQWLLNAAMSANPIVFIIIAIVALIAAIVLIATKTTWFQDIWAAVWGGIQDAAAVVWDWLVGVATATWNALVAALRWYLGIYVAIWDGIKAAAAAVWDWLVGAAKTAWAGVVAAVRFYVDIYVSIFEGIRSAIGAVWSWLQDTASSALNAILSPIRAVASAFDTVVDAIRDVITWLGKIKIPDVLSSIGDAIGGIFGRSAAPAAARSTGTPFAGTSGLGARTFAAPSLSAGAGSSSGSGTTIVVQGALDPVAVARQIRQILTTDQRRRAGVVIA